MPSPDPRSSKSSSGDDNKSAQQGIVQPGTHGAGANLSWKNVYDSFILKGQSLQMGGDYDLAAQEFKGAHRLAVKYSGATNETSCSALAQGAVSTAFAGRVDDALHMATKLLNDSLPLKIESRLQYSVARASVYLAAGNPESAKGSLTEILEEFQAKGLDDQSCVEYLLALQMLRTVYVQTGETLKEVYVHSQIERIYLYMEPLEHAGALYASGRMLMRRNLVDQAESEFAAATKIIISNLPSRAPQGPKEIEDREPAVDLLVAISIRRLDMHNDAANYDAVKLVAPDLIAALNKHSGSKEYSIPIWTKVGIAQFWQDDYPSAEEKFSHADYLARQYYHKDHIARLDPTYFLMLIAVNLEMHKAALGYARKAERLAKLNDCSVHSEHIQELVDRISDQLSESSQNKGENLRD